MQKVKLQHHGAEVKVCVIDAEKPRGMKQYGARTPHGLVGKPTTHWRGFVSDLQLMD
jgi:hypothetical protein